MNDEMTRPSRPALTLDQMLEEVAKGFHEAGFPMQIAKNAVGILVDRIRHEHGEGRAAKDIIAFAAVELYLKGITGFPQKCLCGRLYFPYQQFSLRCKACHTKKEQNGHGHEKA